MQGNDKTGSCCSPDTRVTPTIYLGPVDGQDVLPSGSNKRPFCNECGYTCNGWCKYKSQHNYARSSKHKVWAYLKLLRTMHEIY